MSNFTRNDFKISFYDETYNVDAKKGTVLCTMYCIVNVPEGEYIGVFDNKFGPMYVQGIARCANTDKFDETIGRKIARTRAENKAYARVAKEVRKLVDEVSQMALMAGYFNEKTRAVVSHNIDYIKKIENTVKPVVENKPVCDKNNNKVKTYTKDTPWGKVTITESQLTSEELDQRFKEMEKMINRIFSRHWPF